MKKKSVQANNRKLILDHLRDADAVSVSNISEHVKISKPTVKKVLDYYAGLGIIYCAGKGDSTQEGGKKPDIYRFNENHGYVIALHIGPDFVFAAVMNLSMEMVHSVQHRLGKISADEAVQLLADKVSAFLQLGWSQGKELKNIVIALPGIVNPVSGESIFTPHYPQWGTNYPFAERFSRLLPVKVPVYIDGINRLQAFAEQVTGKARGKKNFIILDAMDEGVGAGIIVDGHMLHGSHNLSGEIGHMILDPQGPECICGGKGCFEAVVSVRNINRIIREGYASHGDSVIFNGKTPEDVSVRDLFRVADQKDPYAMEILEKISTFFATGLNNVIMINDPELIIIQGIYIQAGEIFLENLKNKINRLSFPHLEREVELVYTSFGKERGVVGSGSFGVHKFFESADLYVRKQVKPF